MITIKNKKIICRGKFSSYQITHFLDNRGNSRAWEWFSKENVVVILPITKGNRIICINNYRIPIESYIIELPAGLLNTNIRPKKQAQKELLEETGYVCEKIILIGKFPLNAGITNNFVTYFVGINAKPSGDRALEESEDINIRILNLRELVNLSKDKNTIIDPGIFSLIYLAQNNGYLKE